jgi:hypothetical protein
MKADKVTLLARHLARREERNKIANEIDTLARRDPTHRELLSGLASKVRRGQSVLETSEWWTSMPSPPFTPEVIEQDTPRCRFIHSGLLSESEARAFDALVALGGGPVTTWQIVATCEKVGSSAMSVFLSRLVAKGVVGEDRVSPGRKQYYVLDHALAAWVRQEKTR